jgi:hypothetical protein
LHLRNESSRLRRRVESIALAAGILTARRLDVFRQSGGEYNGQHIADLLKRGLLAFTRRARMGIHEGC